MTKKVFRLEMVNENGFELLRGNITRDLKDKSVTNESPREVTFWNSLDKTVTLAQEHYYRKLAYYGEVIYVMIGSELTDDLFLLTNNERAFRYDEQTESFKEVEIKYPKGKMPLIISSSINYTRQVAAAFNYCPMKLVDYCKQTGYRLEVDHYNNDRRVNNFENLRWVSSDYNNSRNGIAYELVSIDNTFPSEVYMSIAEMTKKLPITRHTLKDFEQGGNKYIVKNDDGEYERLSRKVKTTNALYYIRETRRETVNSYVEALVYTEYNEILDRCVINRYKYMKDLGKELYIESIYDDFVLKSAGDMVYYMFKDLENYK